VQDGSLLTKEVICSYVYKMLDFLDAPVERYVIKRVDFRKGKDDICHVFLRDVRYTAQRNIFTSMH